MSCHLSSSKKNRILSYKLVQICSAIVITFFTAKIYDVLIIVAYGCVKNICKLVDDQFLKL
jgi:hypothetical protein